MVRQLSRAWKKAHGYIQDAEKEIKIKPITYVIGAAGWVVTLTLVCGVYYLYRLGIYL